jgi:hypothetical protein
VIGTLSVAGGTGLRWAVLVLAALLVAAGAAVVLRTAARGPGVRGPMERAWTALPVVLLIALVALAVRTVA